MRRFFFILPILVLTGCGSTQTAPETAGSSGSIVTSQEQGFVFGNIQVYLDDRRITEGAVVTFTHGVNARLSWDGFIAVNAPQGNLGIRRVNIQGSSMEYTLQNLNLRVGPNGSKTYFGHLIVAIKRPAPGNIDMTERWNWNVANKWKEGWAEWNARRGQDKLKFYASPAERLGQNVPLKKAVPMGRQQVEMGF